MKMRPLLKNPDEYNDPPRPFFEHIVALRECLIHAVLAWAICCILVGVFSPSVLGWLKAPAAALEAAGGERDIIVYTCTNKNAVGFYERLGMVRADDVMVYNHTDWTGFVVE